MAAAAGVLRMVVGDGDGGCGGSGGGGGSGEAMVSTKLQF